MSTPFSAFGSKPRALFLAGEAPYPTIGGGPIRAASVLEYLARRFSVHGIFFREPGAPDPADAIPAGRLDRVDVIDLPFHSKGPLSRVLRNATRLARNRAPLVDRFSGFGAQIERCLAGQHYAAAFVEQFWCAPYIQQIRPSARQVILDVYNIESVWHGRMASSDGGLLAWSHGRFARAALDLERYWLPQFDYILATSGNDEKLMQAIAAGARITVYPNALPHVVPPPRAERHEIVFSGNLEYAPNIAAVQFFHRNVWPALQSRWPKLRWKILGKNPGPSIRELAARDSSIEVTGFVEDAVAAIAQSQVAIVPLLAGSGTRIKILEAWAAGTPVVSTRVGAEGLEFRDREHLILADDAESFTAAVSELLALPVNRERIGAAGRRLYEEQYTWPSAWKALDKLFDPDAQLDE
ncbi:MAG: glycosyltransferase [Bryobacteraceae bacterium]|jgi:glycosyltransferase involved in cell wall biosynthesis